MREREIKKLKNEKKNEKKVKEGGKKIIRQADIQRKIRYR